MGDRTTIHSETADVTTLSIGRVFVTRWHAPPVETTFARVSEDVERFARTTSNVFYVGISDEKSGTPDEATQKKVVAAAVGILRRVDTMVLVIEGDSLRANLSRTLFRGMIMAAKLGNRVVGFEVGDLASKVTLRDSIDTLLRTMPTTVGIGRAELLAAFERSKPRPAPPG